MFTLLRANKNEKEFEVKEVMRLHEIEDSQIDTGTFKYLNIYSYTTQKKVATAFRLRSKSM
jgi:hypothetical protein